MPKPMHAMAPSVDESRVMAATASMFAAGLTFPQIMAAFAYVMAHLSDLSQFEALVEEFIKILFPPTPPA